MYKISMMHFRTKPDISNTHDRVGVGSLEIRAVDRQSKDAGSIPVRHRFSEFSLVAY